MRSVDRSPYRRLVLPLLFGLEPEAAHESALAALRRGLALGPLRAALRRRLAAAPRALHRRLFGRAFVHPVGLAAGFDKDAAAIEELAALGFSHVEAGTLTGTAQPGNPRPRAFRLPRDRALINRMGFNNRGAADAARRLAARYEPRGGARRPPCALGLNLGKTKAVPVEEALDDYRVSIAAVARFADYLVINVSSPNTPGLRDLQAEAALRPLAEGVRAAVDADAPGVPVLLKLAPDLDPAGIDAAVDVALGAGFDGLICTNTTIARSPLRSPSARVAACGDGGLSGAPLRRASTAVLARVARRVAGRVPLVGVGGVEDADDAWEKICHGADLVQVYTGLIYRGPTLVRGIVAGLRRHLDAAGLGRIGDAVGRWL